MEKRNPKEGDIVVRIHAGSPVSESHVHYNERQKGAIIKVTETRSGKRAYYSPNSSIPEDDWRYATREEERMYNDGIRNLSEEKISITNLEFSFYVGERRDIFNDFKKILNLYNIDLSNLGKYNGTGTFYYTVKGKSLFKCTAYQDKLPKENRLSTKKELDKYLNNLNKQKNEKIRINQEGQRNIRAGNLEFPTRTRQTTVGSRQVGNPANYQLIKARIAKSKISGEVISF